jgi:chromosome segregation ATPase
MIEQIEQLESRVDALARLLEASRQQNAQLQQENSQLRDQLGVLQQLKSQNGELENQVQHLETELEGMAQKETQIRDRVRTILERIDAIENELGPTGAAGSR